MEKRGKWPPGSCMRHNPQYSGATRGRGYPGPANEEGPGENPDWLGGPMSFGFLRWRDSAERIEPFVAVFRRGFTSPKASDYSGLLKKIHKLDLRGATVFLSGTVIFELNQSQLNHWGVSPDHLIDFQFVTRGKTQKKGGVRELEGRSPPSPVVGPGSAQTSKKKRRGVQRSPLCILDRKGGHPQGGRRAPSERGESRPTYGGPCDSRLVGVPLTDPSSFTLDSRGQAGAERGLHGRGYQPDSGIRATTMVGEGREGKVRTAPPAVQQPLLLRPGLMTRRGAASKINARYFFRHTKKTTHPRGNKPPFPI